MYKTWAIIFYLFPLVFTQGYKGDSCNLPNSNQKGRCVIIDDCNYAKNLLSRNERPVTCGFQHLTPIVCCPLPPPNLPKQQTKSEKACKDYRARGPFFVFLGEKALSQEFPHMAAIGFGDDNNIQWLCGGSLISEQIVLTAAHCLYSQEFGKAKLVRLGDLDLSITTDNANPKDFQIVERIPHPNYSPPLHYHDIALLKLNESVKFGVYIKPICLYPKNELPSTMPIVTGWGKTQFAGESSPHLLKASLQYARHDKCKEYYEDNVRRLPNGILEEIQLCAGDSSGSDSCQGDSGGPLQFNVDGYYMLTGVTSFGKACGVGATPGVYTRVSYYLPWIEDTIWPNSYNEN